MGKMNVAAAMIAVLWSMPTVWAAGNASPAERVGPAVQPTPAVSLQKRIQSAKQATDGQSLQGTWKVVKKTKNGEAEDTKAAPAVLTISGDTVTLTVGGEEQSKGTFTIDESKTPKRITLTGTSGHNAGKTFEAIYELDGDTFKLAYGIGPDAGSPPKDFAGGKGQAVEVLERQGAKAGKSEG